MILALSILLGLGGMIVALYLQLRTPDEMPPKAFPRMFGGSLLFMVCGVLFNTVFQSWLAVIGLCVGSALFWMGFAGHFKLRFNQKLHEVRGTRQM